MNSIVVSLSTYSLSYNVKSQPFTAYEGITKFTLPDSEDIQELSCGKNQFFQNISNNSSNSVHYFKLSITSNMKQLYTSKFEMTTCCKFCDYTYESLYEAEIADFDVIQEEFDKIYNITYYNNWMTRCNMRNFGVHYGLNLTALSTTNSILDITNNPQLIQTYNEYCTNNGSSLDTYLYVLQEKKGELVIISKSDDCTELKCTDNTEKSYIDLLDYEEGEYIIAISGFNSHEFGSYFLQLRCNEYTYPIEPSQLQPLSSGNISQLLCDDTIQNQKNTEISQVSYYMINITDTLFQRLPITISTCSPSGYDSYMYIFEETSEETYDIIAQSDDNPSCGGYLDSKYTLTKKEISAIGVYYVAIQGVRNTVGEFSISTECNTLPPTTEPSISPTKSPSLSPTASPTIPPEINSHAMAATLGSLFGVLLIIFGVYYVRELIVFHDDKQKELKQELQSTVSPTKTTSGSGCEIALQLPGNDMEKQLSEELLSDDDDGGDNNDNKLVTVDENIETPDDEFNNDITFKIPKRGTVESGFRSVDNSHPVFSRPVSVNWNGTARMSINNVDVRRLDQERSIIKQTDDEQDVVQTVLADSIDCCNNKEEFDIYQVLAIRYYHENSRKIRGTGWRPFKKLGYDHELIRWSPYYQSMGTAIVIGTTQTWGISVVAWKLVNAYFSDDFVCDMTVERWGDVFSLKILALLLSLVVTFFIQTLLNGIRHNGLYEITDTLELADVERIDNVAIFFIQFGKLVNYYVCAMAILGSYFIIFIANEGEEQDDGSIDYSASGLDMILNAIALFFLLELDNLIISDDDWEVCSEHLQDVLEGYEPDTRINEKYMDEDEKKEYEEKNEEKGVLDRKSRTESFIMDTMNKCNVCIGPFMYYAINVFSVFVTVFCYTGGFIAPFLIFFCW